VGNCQYLAATEAAKIMYHYLVSSDDHRAAYQRFIITVRSIKEAQQSGKNLQDLEDILVDGFSVLTKKR
jgi:hypothetical protein